MTSITVIDGDGQTSTSSQTSVSFAWLEITPSCQLTCEHCYAASGPGLGHGKLRLADWQETIDGLRIMGVQTIQFIGGEPTIHPHFCELIEYAAKQDFSIEVYSNLVGITQRMWDLFTRYNVSIATSFYSTKAHIHDAITHLPGSYLKTLGNIKKTLALGLTLRMSIVDIRDNQDIPATVAFLKQLRVDPNSINVDRVRGVGRGLNLSKEDAVSALCGKCASGQCAITAEGTVYPCIMARSFPLGSVLEKTIDDILTGETFKSTSDILNAAFAARVSSSIPLCGPPPQPPPCLPSGPRPCLPSGPRPPCPPLAPCSPRR